MTRRKSKQAEAPLDNQALAARVCSEARSIAEEPFVLTVEDHFAGYFNELGLFISVKEDASDLEVVNLRNKLLEHFESALPEGSAPFLWQVQFKRHAKIIEVLFPGDKPRRSDEVLYSL